MKRKAVSASMILLLLLFAASVNADAFSTCVGNAGRKYDDCQKTTAIGVGIAALSLNVFALAAATANSIYCDWRYQSDLDNCMPLVN